MLFLSQIIGRPVRDPAGEPLGTVADLIVAIGDRTRPSPASSSPPTAARSSCPGARSSASTRPGRACASRRIDIGKFQQRPDEILLRGGPAGQADRRHRRAARSSGSTTCSLDEVEGALRVVAVDVGAAGLLRRLGIEGPYRTIARNLRLPVPERYIDWEDVDPLESIDRRQSASASRTRSLAELHPVGPRLDHRPARPARPGRRPGLPRRRGRRRRDGGDGARHPGRRPRGPRTRSGRPTSSRR